MGSITQVQIPNKVFRILHKTNSIGNGINLTLLLPAMGKYLGK